MIYLDYHSKDIRSYSSLNRDQSGYLVLFLGKENNLLIVTELDEFVEIYQTKQLSENSWLVDIGTINEENWDLTVNNPNIVEEIDNRTPQEIIAEIEQLDVQAAEALQKIKDLL